MNFIDATIYVVLPVVLMIVVVHVMLPLWRKPSVKRGIQPQPAPVANEHPAVWDLVIADMNARDEFGLTCYGVRLRPHNGRDMLYDAYHEALDLCVYLRGAMYERDGH